MSADAARLAVILSALDHLREVYPTNAALYAEAMFLIVEAVSLAKDE